MKGFLKRTAERMRLGFTKTFRYYLPVTLVAMALAWVSTQVATWAGYDLPPQDLVKFFTNPNVPWMRKVQYGALALVVCPPVEEVIFRLGLFNGLDWLFGKFTRRPAFDAARFPWAAALASGIVFAAVHQNAATLVPLWFLGVAFAWVYRKGGTIWASVYCHVFFNLVNFVLCLLCPDAVKA